MKKYIRKILLNNNIHIMTKCFRVENLVSKYRKMEIEEKEKKTYIILGAAVGRRNRTDSWAYTHVVRIFSKTLILLKR